MLNNKYLGIIIIIAILIIGFNIWYLILPPEYNTENGEIEITANQPLLGEENAILYMEDGFIPKTLKIKLGTTVTFKNNSLKSLWIASDNHPTHALYPATDGCIASTFDSCKSIKQGEIWSFKFDVAGNWGYHNHMNHNDGGTIIVE